MQDESSIRRPFFKLKLVSIFMNDMSLRPVPAPEMTSVEALHPKERRSRRFAWIGMAASIILFSASLVVLWHVVSGIDLNELKTAFTAASFRQIGLAILLDRGELQPADLLRRYRVTSDQGQYSLPHNGSGVVHELCGQLHPGLPSAHGRHGPLLDLRSERVERRAGCKPHGHCRGNVLARDDAGPWLEHDQASG